MKTLEELKDELYADWDGAYDTTSLYDSDVDWIVWFALITDIGNFNFIETEDKNIFVCDELEMEYFHHHQSSGYSYVS